MYELVNTSMPNGLIAGTHGFATVAMTKGMSDVLRGRLEALCAYTHRTNAHDAAYYQQNPVNWFHVTLPQGEHVVGRVAPSDFDYTGRTNRLARVRVFGANEMPSVGGAEILAKEKLWFSQPWQGDPRYLAEDRNTCGHLRMLEPAQFSSAPAWDTLFGSNGSRYAQQVAWQVEKNLAAGGKTIYFKTSTAWDVSGEKLLGLFADVINLLPEEMRARVTFSTYPVSLPGGTACNLRGIYDRDKFFDASSSAQAWVDCENAKIVHAEMLPTSGSVKRSESQKEKSREQDAERNSVSRFPSASAASKSSRRQGSSAGGNPNSYGNLIAPPKKGLDGVVVGIVIATVIILLSAGGIFFWMAQENKRQMKSSGAATAIETKALEDEKERQIRLEEEKRAQLEKEKREQEEEERRNAEQENARELERKELDKREKAKRDEEAEQEADNKAAQIAAELAMARAENERNAKKHQAVAYLDAKEFRRGIPSYRYDSLSRKCTEPFEMEDGCCVYYYIGNVVTNEPAGFKVNPTRPEFASLRWGVGLSKKPDEIPLACNGFVLWYNPKAKRVYIDLNRRAPQGKDGEPWFAESSLVNLAQKYFGPDSHFEELWSKSRGGKAEYLINWKFTDPETGKTSNSPKTIKVDKSEWTDLAMIAEIRKDAVRKFDTAIKKAKEKVLQLEAKEKTLEDDLKKLASATNAMTKVHVAYNECAKSIEGNKAKIDKLQKDAKKNKESISNLKKENLRLQNRQGDILGEGTDSPSGKRQKGPSAYKNLEELEKEMKDGANDVKKKEEELNTCGEQIKEAKQDVEKKEIAREVYLKSFEKSFKSVRFLLHVVGEKIEEEEQ